MQTATATLRKPATSSNESIPGFYNPKNAGQWGYRPDASKIFVEAHDWKKKYGLKPSVMDDKKVHLLLIDEQQDFCLPMGTLYVGGRSGKGAIEDSARTAEFIYRNLSSISKITATLDTHVPFQIFFQSFWEKADGSPVDPHTVITTVDLDSSKFRVSPQAASALEIDYVWLSEHARYYTSELEKAGKYVLYIWPFHCELGSEGHALVGLLKEACTFHTFARGSAFTPETKGGNPLTENYSVLRPEVLTRHDGKGAIAQRNSRFIGVLMNADRVIVAGQAASHCVKSSIDDILTEIVGKDPALAKKVYVMSDCMSAVAVPDGKGGFFADFTREAEDALKRFADAGMHVVKSTDPIDSWPEF